MATYLWQDFNGTPSSRAQQNEILHTFQLFAIDLTSQTDGRATAVYGGMGVKTIMVCPGIFLWLAFNTLSSTANDKYMKWAKIRWAARDLQGVKAPRVEEAEEKEAAIQTKADMNLHSMLRC
jgi:hypothetical protein